MRWLYIGSCSQVLTFLEIQKLASRNIVFNFVKNSDVLYSKLLCTIPPLSWLIHCITLFGCPWSLVDLIRRNKTQPMRVLNVKSVIAFDISLLTSWDSFPSCCPRVKTFGLGISREHSCLFLLLSIYGPVVHDCVQLLFEPIDTLRYHKLPWQIWNGKNQLKYHGYTEINKILNVL